MHEYAPEPPTRRPDDVNVARLIRTVVRGLPILLVALVIGGCVGLSAMRFIPARYVSSVSILIDPKGPGAYGGDGEFTSVSVDNSKISNVELLLVSSELLGKVVDSQHLADQPAFGTAEPSRLRGWLPFLKPRSMSNTPDARRMRAIERLGQMVQTARAGITYVITLTVTAGDPATAQRLAQAIGDTYIADESDVKLDAIRHDTAWLTDRLAQQRHDLTASETAVESIRKKYGILASGGGTETTVDRQSITEVNDSLVRAQVDAAAAEAKYQQALHVAQSGGDLEGLSDVDSSGVVNDLRTQQAALKRRMADISARYAASFPERRQVEKDLQAVNSQVAQEVARIVDKLRNDAQTAVANRAALQKQLSGLVGTVSAADSAEGRVELRDAERVADANRAAYDASLAQMRQVEQQQTRPEVEARIISQAFMPDSPSFPKATLCAAGGAGLGLFAGLGLIFLFPYHRHRVLEADSAEHSFALPVLAEAPLLRKRDLRVGTVVLSIPEYLVVRPMSRFAESLRRLRLALQIVGKGGSRIIQVTSAVPGEGKSTMAAGLAISAATAGIRTVILDLDFHRPSIAKIFVPQNADGNFDVLLGSSATGTELRRRETLPLRIIDAGSVGEPQPGMVESAKLQALIKELQREYDLVVLDTPPVLAISDPLFISGIVDATVLVVAWGRTHQKLVDNALSALRAINAPVSGLLLNKVDLAKNSRYGGQNYNYEGYGTP